MTEAANTALSLSGARRAPALEAALKARAKILEMTQAAEDAVLRPVDAGGWPAGQRAAMAARIARLNRDETLAAHYAAGAGDAAALADPAERGDDERMRAVLRFMDAAARDPRDMVADDIARLQVAGISDADIVRLAELNAFLAYQVRLVAGLRLLAETPA